MRVGLRRGIVQIAGSPSAVHSRAHAHVQVTCTCTCIHVHVMFMSMSMWRLTVGVSLLSVFSKPPKLSAREPLRDPPSALRRARCTGGRAHRRRLLCEFYLAAGVLAACETAAARRRHRTGHTTTTGEACMASRTTAAATTGTRTCKVMSTAAAATGTRTWLSEGRLRRRRIGLLVGLRAMHPTSRARAVAATSTPT